MSFGSHLDASLQLGDQLLDPPGTAYDPPKQNKISMTNVKKWLAQIRQFCMYRAEIVRAY